MKTVAELNKAIASIKAQGAKLDKRIQTTAVEVLEHFAVHKDNGVVNRLFLALPNGARRNALASWLLAYGALKPNTGPNKADQPFVYDREKKTDPARAAADMWYDHKPEKAVDEVFDLQKAVRAILKKAGKAPTLANGDYDTLKALAASVGIPESDVPTRPPADTAPF